MKIFFQSKFFLICFIGLWFLAVAIPIGYQMGFHQAFKSSLDNKAIVELTNGKRTVLHLIGADCQCSIKVVDHLAKRAPIKKINEKIIIVGNGPELVKKLSAAGFVVEQMAADLAYDRYSLKSLPQMMIYDSKKVIYSGGYSNKRGPANEEDYDDLKIINQFFQGISSESRPIFGCANGKEFRNQIDPFKLKY